MDSSFCESVQGARARDEARRAVDVVAPLRDVEAASLA